MSEDDPTFFFDNTHSLNIVVAFRSLGALGCSVRHLTDDFKPSTRDVDWMPVVGKNGWTVITGDRRIVRNTHERAVRFEVKLTTVFMPRKFMETVLWEQWLLLVKAWPNIVEYARRARPGDCFEVRQNGSVNLMPAAKTGPR